MKIILHYPNSAVGINDLAQRVSSVQASFVQDQLKALTCPTEQKLALLKTVIESSRNSEFTASSNVGDQFIMSDGA